MSRGWGRVAAAALTASAAVVGLVVNLVGFGAPAARADTPKFTAIIAGGSHTCALTSGGGIECWGDNSHGQLGNGTTTSSSTPVPVVGLTSGVIAVSAGLTHTCALTSAGAVECWGANDSGQLGNGTTINSSTPVAVIGLSGVIAISAGAAHTCALTSGGQVDCWGNNFWGQLGNGTTASPFVRPGPVFGLSSGVVAISAGWDHSCALTAGGGVQCWGNNGNGQLGNGTTINSSTPVAVIGLSSGVRALSAGGFHTCALTSGGGVDCWGDDSNGQVGDGVTGVPASPVPVGVIGLSSGVSAISAGGYHVCALIGGGVECWGANGNGQLGNPLPIDRSTPVPVSGLPSVSEVSAGGFHTCTLTKGGGGECWGWNAFGQLGNGTTTDSPMPVKVQS